MRRRPGVARPGGYWSVEHLDEPRPRATPPTAPDPTSRTAGSARAVAATSTPTTRTCSSASALVVPDDARALDGRAARCCTRPGPRWRAPRRCSGSTAAAAGVDRARRHRAGAAAAPALAAMGLVMLLAMAVLTGSLLAQPADPRRSALPAAPARCRSPTGRRQRRRRRRAAARRRGPRRRRLGRVRARPAARRAGRPAGRRRAPTCARPGRDARPPGRASTASPVYVVGPPDGADAARATSSSDAGRASRPRCSSTAPGRCTRRSPARRRARRARPRRRRRGRRARRPGPDGAATSRCSRRCARRAPPSGEPAGRSRALTTLVAARAAGRPDHPIEEQYVREQPSPWCRRHRRRAWRCLALTACGADGDELRRPPRTSSTTRSTASRSTPPSSWCATLRLIAAEGAHPAALRADAGQPDPRPTTRSSARPSGEPAVTGRLIGGVAGALPVPAGTTVVVGSDRGPQITFPGLDAKAAPGCPSPCSSAAAAPSPAPCSSATPCSQYSDGTVPHGDPPTSATAELEPSQRGRRRAAQVRSTPGH